MNPLLLTDYYKTEHHRMYPEGTTKIYSNFTPRKSRIPGVNHVVVFGIQYFVLKYLIKKFKKNFFARPWPEIEAEYKRHVNIDTSHIKALWELGYLPIRIKALPEGTLCPIGVPLLTITNTHPAHAWLVNYLETLLSCVLWQPITSATLAYGYKKLLTKYAIETTGSDEGVQWQAHDFSMRGMSSPESAISSGMGHLTCFTGTDTIPAIYELEKYYGSQGLIGASVPATEHSVMCMGTKEGELETVKRLLRMYPSGVLSIVYDTWDLFGGIEKIRGDVEVKRMILARDGKLVLRPDSGDPVDIICGTAKPIDYEMYLTAQKSFTSTQKGVIELLWDIFGGKINSNGYKELDPHIGAIYGDGITPERATAICERLKAKGFASTNVVLGVGSFTYQHNTRDSFGFAMKATYGEVLVSTMLTGEDEHTEAREIFKAPLTDSGEKKSAKGLLCVHRGPQGNGELELMQQCSPAVEEGGLLETIFDDGRMVKVYNLDYIRSLLKINSLAVQKSS